MRGWSGSRLVWLLYVLALAFDGPEAARNAAANSPGGQLGRADQPGPVAVAVAALVSSLFQPVAVGLLVCLPLLFPTGRPPSRRWWVLVWVVAAGVVLFSVGAGLAPARYEAFPGVENPFGIAGLATVLGWIDGVGGVLFVAGLLGTLASLVAVIDQTMEPSHVSCWLRPSPPSSSRTARSEPRPAPWAY